jgi:hypothetical protein
VTDFPIRFARRFRGLCFAMPSASATACASLVAATRSTSTGNFATVYLLTPPNLDTGERRAVRSRGGSARETFVRPAVRPPNPPVRTQKAMDLTWSALIAPRKATPISGDVDGRSAPASS